MNVEMFLQGVLFFFMFVWILLEKRWRKTTKGKSKSIGLAGAIFMAVGFLDSFKIIENGLLLMGIFLTAVLYIVNERISILEDQDEHKH